MGYTTFEGKLKADGLKLALVVSRFNSLFTDKLLEGAVDCIRRHGGSDEDVAVAYVPGAFEIPFAAGKLAASGAYDAVVCLGAVIRGDTPHFDYIAKEVSRGVAQVGWDYGLPSVFGVIVRPSSRAFCRTMRW